MNEYGALATLQTSTLELSFTDGAYCPLVLFNFLWGSVYLGKIVYAWYTGDFVYFGDKHGILVYALVYRYTALCVIYSLTLW